MRLPHITKPCPDCPFRKDCLKGWLGKPRIEEILKADSFVCHKNTRMQCAGHMLIKGRANAFVQIATRFGFRLNLTGRENVFENEVACIAHHSEQPEQ